MTERRHRIHRRKYGWRLLYPAVLLFTAHVVCAQCTLGGNLILNGDAEAGSAGTPATLATSIPNWTRAAGIVNVLPYGLTGYVLLSDPTPAPPPFRPGPGFQYFVSGDNKLTTSTLTQTIDVSSCASAISGGNVKFTASAYLGSTLNNGTATVGVSFQNGTGQEFSSATLGPLGFGAAGMSLQQQIGLVPAGTVRIAVTLGLSSDCILSGCNLGAADGLSLVLNTLGTSPGAVLGTNLIVNGGAEAGPGARTATTLYVPGWSTANGATVAPYGGTNWIATSDPGPPDRGVNLFCGPGTSYQDIDVSAAATLIDSGQVTYEVSAWLGSLTGTSPTLTYTFFDWSGKLVATIAQLGPTSHSVIGLVETSHSGVLPSGTRRVHVSVAFAHYYDLADDIAFTLAAPGGPPVIDPLPGVVSASAYGGYSSIAPGSWVEIYGTYLTSGPLRNNCPGFAGSCWTTADFTNGVAPTSIDGVSVSIGGQAAFIDFTSPGQINAQVPSNAPTGLQSVKITNSNGASLAFPIIVNPTEPGWLAPSAFTISGKQYVAAILSDGSYALPANAISGVPSRPAHIGETVTIYGIGFGPVTGGITAGAIVPQQNSLTTPMQVLFGTTPATISYYGLAPSYVGLYQFNVVVPNATANNAVTISFSLGGVKGTQTLYIAVQN